MPTVDELPVPGRRRLPPTIFAFVIVSFLSDVSTEMLLPILPLLLVRELRAPAGVVGVIEGVAQAAQYIAQGFSGWVADRVRRPRPIALAGYAVAAIAKPFIGLAVSWPTVLGGRMLDRAGSGTRSAPRDAMIAAAAGDRRGAAFGLEGAGDNLGAVAGPLLTAALLAVAQPPLRVLCFLAAIPGALALALMASIPVATDEAPVARERLRIGALPGRYWCYVGAAAVYGLGNVSSAFVILQTVRAGIPVAATVLVYAGFNLAAAAVSYPAGALSDARGRGRVLLAGALLPPFAFLGLALTSSTILAVLLFAAYGAYQGVFRAVGKALATDLAPRELRASAIGMYSAAIGVAALVANIVGGQIWDRVSPAAMFEAGAVMTLIGWALLAALVRDSTA